MYAQLAPDMVRTDSTNSPPAKSARGTGQSAPPTKLSGVSQREGSMGIVSDNLGSRLPMPHTFQYPRLHEWVDSVTGLVALGRLIFPFGLPGWAIVRWVFNFIERNRDAGIDEVAKEVRDVV